MNHLIFDSFNDELTKIANLNRVLRLEKALKKRPNDAALRKSYETAVAAHKRRTSVYGIAPDKRKVKQISLPDYIKFRGRGGFGGMVASIPFALHHADPNIVLHFAGMGGGLGDLAYSASIAAPRIRQFAARRRYARLVGAKNPRDPQLLHKAKAYSNRRAAQVQAQRADDALMRAAEEEVADLNPTRRQYQALAQKMGR